LGRPRQGSEFYATTAKKPVKKLPDEKMGPEDHFHGGLPDASPARDAATGGLRSGLATTAKGSGAESFETIVYVW
jgi:hypothetical protein